MKAPSMSRRHWLWALTIEWPLLLIVFVYVSHTGWRVTALVTLLVIFHVVIPILSKKFPSRTYPDDED